MLQQRYSELLGYEESQRCNYIKFFLKGVASVSDEATDSAKQIIGLQQRYSELLGREERQSGNYIKLLNNLFETPVISKKEVAELLEVSSNTAGTIVDKFCEIGILKDETPEKQRYKKYIFEEYFEILRRGTDLE